MNQGYPIFTAEAECQDCFKCVRHCPVKAIKVEGGHASVMPELCIACGGCVEVCPVHAKKIRDDMGRARQLILSGVPVHASLAPSWVNEFKGLPKEKMIASLKRLGFAAVSETALGAQIVSDRVAELLKEKKSGVMISSACPVTVDFIRKYLPEFTDCISPVLSPALSHAKLLHKLYGDKIKVVFIGPCIAKKNEADRHPGEIALAMLYPRLRQWFKEAGIDPWLTEAGPEDRFTPETAKDGALYPIEGGMNDTLKIRPGCEHVTFASVTGIPALRQALGGLHPEDIREPVFLETLACSGGCVHGPGTEHGSPGLLERLRVIRNVQFPERAGAPSPDAPSIPEKYGRDEVLEPQVTLREIKQALQSIGKTTLEDELNCGGCGYFTCNNFAHALLAGKAEPSMCVSYMRKLAQKKSNAMLRCIPAGVVIVDKKLSLIECNRRFAEIAGPDALEIFDAAPGMPGADLSRLISCSDLFEEVLQTRIELNRDTVRIGDNLFSLNIFNIDPGQVVGAMFFDVTQTEFRREQIASRAREVIQKNLTTVQEIACKLGEHMAETEILLRSIADNYAEHGEEDAPSGDRS